MLCNLHYSEFASYVFSHGAFVGHDCPVMNQGTYAFIRSRKNFQQGDVLASVGNKSKEHGLLMCYLLPSNAHFMMTCAPHILQQGSHPNLDPSCRSSASHEPEVWWGVFLLHTAPLWSASLPRGQKSHSTASYFWASLLVQEFNFMRVTGKEMCWPDL
jgi:hypothetical protein